MFSLWLFGLVGAVVDGPQKIIIDTDMGFDVDDVGAVCLGNALMAANKTEILAVVHNTGCKYGIGGVSAINHFYGHDNIILGAWKGEFGSDCDTHFKGTSGQNQYLTKLTENKVFAGPVTKESEVVTGTDAYRQALAAAPNSSVNIASIGMTTNLRDLLATKADRYSNMSGYDLVAAKVNKIVYMDMMYNFGCAAGNIGPSKECYGSAQGALKMPPNVRLIISNKGASPDIYTGGGMQKSHPDNSPCREAYKSWCCNPNGKWGSTGRLSWDPITVMIAALDVGSVLEKETNYGTQITADPSGAEHFFGTGTKNALTTFAFQDSPEKIAKVIDSYLDAPVHPPPRPSPPPPPPPPTPPAKHVCADPGASPGCSVCAACCHSYIPAGSSCDKCAIEKCTQQ